MSGQLSSADRIWIEAAKRDGIFRPFNDNSLDLIAGAIYIGCGDGDYSEHLSQKLNAMVRKQAGFGRLHNLPINGGALTISPTSPLRDLRAYIVPFLKAVLEDKAPDSILLDLLEYFPGPFSLLGRLFRVDMTMIVIARLSVPMKKMKNIVLSAHVPCGAAGGLCGMSFPEVLHHLCLAKKRLKKILPEDVKVPCLIMVEREIYNISTDVARVWLDKNFPPIRQNMFWPNPAPRFHIEVCEPAAA